MSDGGLPKDSSNSLPEECDLKGESVFSAPLYNLNSQAQNQPRALRSLASIVNNDLCHRCGSCAGICPSAVLETDQQGYPRIKSLSACTDCDLCVRVCPGEEFDFSAAHEKTFNKRADFKDTHGEFLQGAIAHAADPLIREGSTSGGLVTAILLELLEQKKIDGALVIVSDDTLIWKGRPVLARSKEELLQSMKSKYAIVPTNAAFAEIRSIPGRYALVGLPCQIHGYYKAAELDKRLAERVVLTIGLFCHAAIEHDAFKIIWENLGEKTRAAKRFISRVGKHPGTPHLQMEDGSFYPVYFGDKKGYRPSSLEVLNIIYRLYTPARCLTCFDALAQFADISVGDPWLAPPEKGIDWHDGWSFTLLRTERGLKAYEECCRSGKVAGLSVTRREALACNRQMANEKRSRAFYLIERYRERGRPIPLYGSTDLRFPVVQGARLVKLWLHLCSHVFCFKTAGREKVLKFFLRDGYFLFWLNHQRRTFKVWRRDTLYRLKKAVRGRQ